jgi:hypothetical protein
MIGPLVGIETCPHCHSFFEQRLKFSHPPIWGSIQAVILTWEVAARITIVNIQTLKNVILSSCCSHSDVFVSVFTSIVHDDREH